MKRKKTYFTLREAAGYLGCSVRLFHQLLKRQDEAPPGFKLGRQWRFLPEELDQFMEENFRRRGE